ncbi:hypothetical protein FJ656_15795 [Schumannella luteola]|nr:hypothetical protein FJ656_15795 [Schumannella luteola]
MFLAVGAALALLTVFEIVLTLPGWGEHGGPYMAMGAVMQSIAAIALILVGVLRFVRTSE